MAPAGTSFGNWRRVVLRVEGLRVEGQQCVWNIVSIFCPGPEHQIRSRSDPHAIEPHSQSADEVQPLDERLLLVERPVLVGVLEDHDPVGPFAFRVSLRVAVSFSHPQAARSSQHIAIGWVTSGSWPRPGP